MKNHLSLKTLVFITLNFLIQLSVSSAYTGSYTIEHSSEKIASTFTIEFIGPCSPKPLLKKVVPHTSGRSSNVGDVSIKVLEDNHVEYQGTAHGINQILNSPIGDDALEVISDNEMLAYGWCYEVDGVISEIFADQFMILPTTKMVRWFYGYAHYLNGNWISQCEKAYENRSKQICGK